MNYILTATRKIDNFPQSIIVKLKGGTGQMFTTMRSYALLIRDFDLNGQSGSRFKSMNYSTMPSIINNSTITEINVKAIIKFNEPNAIDNDTPRATVVSIKNVASSSALVNAVKAQFTAVTGKAYEDTRLYVSNMIISLSAINQETQGGV